MDGDFFSFSLLVKDPRPVALSSYLAKGEHISFNILSLSIGQTTLPRFCNSFLSITASLEFVSSAVRAMVQNGP